MSHWKLLFPNEFLCAADLRDQDVTLTIDRVALEDLKRERGSESRPVMHFIEMRRREKSKQKRLVLNRTNAKTIAKLYGNDVDSWAGCRITLYATECEAFGETVECIRVKSRKPPAKSRTSTPAPDPAREPGDDEDDEFSEPDAPNGDDWDDSDPTVGDE